MCVFEKLRGDAIRIQFDMPNAHDKEDDQIADPFVDRPRKARATEAFLFSLAYFFGAWLFFIPIPQLMGWYGAADDMLVVLIFFAGLSSPLVGVVWYRAASNRRYLSWRRTVGIGVAIIIVPCLVAVILTVGFAILVLPKLLPPAIPAGILITWLFVQARQRILDRQGA